MCTKQGNGFVRSAAKGELVAVAVISTLRERILIRKSERYRYIFRCISVREGLMIQSWKLGGTTKSIVPCWAIGFFVVSIRIRYDKIKGL